MQVRRSFNPPAMAESSTHPLLQSGTVWVSLLVLVDGTARGERGGSQ